MKVVINSQHGGFGLSEKAMLRYAELKGIKLYVDKSEGRWCTMYYTVPVEEYNRVIKEDRKNVGKEKQYENSNALCFSDDNIERNDPLLVQVVEELGDKANDIHAELRVVDVPDDVKWHIEEYDGWEHVAEDHRTWH